jgi:hypothetical protein
MSDPTKYERLYRDDPIHDEPDYDEPIEEMTPEEFQEAQDYYDWISQSND